MESQNSRIEKLKYTDSEFDTKQLIENPADIMYHFIEKELGYKDIVSIDSWKKARDINSSFNLAFSLKEKHKSKDLIEKIAKNTLLYPRFKQDGTFGFTNIKLEYGPKKDGNLYYKHNLDYMYANHKNKYDRFMVIAK